MALTIHEATLTTLKGSNVSKEKVREGYIMNVAGEIITHEKKKFIRIRVIYENGEFFLQRGEKVNIIPKVAISS